MDFARIIILGWQEEYADALVPLSSCEVLHCGKASPG